MCVEPRLIAYRPAFERIVDAPGRLGVCFESALSQLWPSLGLGKEDKSCSARGVEQPSPLIKRQPHPSNCPAPAMGLRLLAAALLAATAHGACEACMKYLDATWGGRGPYACNDTWAAAQGYDACPPPKTCDFALAQQGDDTCKQIYPADANGRFTPESGTARCQESGCCNSTRDSKEAEQYGSDLCPPQILSFEQGIYLYATCSENEDLCPEPDLAPGFVADVNPCWYDSVT